MLIEIDARVRRMVMLRVVLVFVLLMGGCGFASSSAPKQPLPDPLVGVKGADLYQEGKAHFQRGDYLRAEQYFSAAISKGYPKRDALGDLVRACVASSRISTALSHANPYLKRHPADWPLRLLVATLHMGLDEYVVAQKHLKRVLFDQPNQPDAHYFLGVIYRDKLPREGSVEAHFRSYMEVAPDGQYQDEVSDYLRLSAELKPISSPSKSSDTIVDPATSPPKEKEVKNGDT